MMRFQDFENFIGPTGKLVVRNLILATRDKSPPVPVSRFFFNNYKSPVDVLGRATSIMTDPLLIGVASLVSAGVAVGFLVASVTSLVTANPKEAGDRLAITCNFAIRAVALLMLAVLSPLINLVDLVASGAKTAIEKNPTPAPVY